MFGGENQNMEIHNRMTYGMNIQLKPETCLIVTTQKSVCGGLMKKKREKKKKEERRTGK